jgi:hypothetical protein
MAGKRHCSAGSDQTATIVNAVIIGLFGAEVPLGEIKTGVRAIYEVTGGCQQGPESTLLKRYLRSASTTIKMTLLKGEET